MKIEKDIQILENKLKQINSTREGRRLFLASIPFLIAGCASSSKDQSRYREGDNSGQAALSVQEEEKMTKDYLPEMEKDYPKFKNEYAQKYINDLGQKIVIANKLNSNPYNYNFRIVASDQINAFALPAGEVFVTSKLIEATDSEAELAGVVGHEIGHIQARHTAERLHKAESEKSKTLLYGVGGALLGGVGGFVLAKKLCRKEDRECLARIAKYGAAAGGLGGLLIQKYGFMANSREDEMEADRIGFKTSLNAGFDHAHIGNFYEKLLIMEKSHQKKANSMTKAFSDALSTHPPSEDRVAQMREMERKYTGKGIVSSDSYNKVKKII